MTAKKYKCSIRCYFKHSTNYTHHLQRLSLWDIGKWIEAYRFTHPSIESISVKVYFDEEGERDEATEQ